MNHFEVLRIWCQKKEIDIFDKWLISLDHVTYVTRSREWVTCRKFQFLFSYTTVSQLASFWCKPYYNWILNIDHNPRLSHTWSARIIIFIIERTRVKIQLHTFWMPKALVLTVVEHIILFVHVRCARMFIQL